MATLKDVAKEARTSITTVSLVLNNKAEERGISPETQTRVRNAAKLLSYRRNPHARALRTGYSNVIGVVGKGLDRPIPYAKTYVAAQILHELGFSVVTYDFDWHHQDPSGMIDFIESLGVAGILMAAYDDGVYDTLLQCMQNGVPLVCMDDWNLESMTAVGVDRFEGAYQAVDHLIKLGHKKIAITAARNSQSAHMAPRAEGYIKAHEDNSLPVDEALFIGPPDATTFTRGYDVTNSILLHPLVPTAVFCSNDEVALGLIRGLYENKLRVPDDLSVIGFNDGIDAARSVVPLTSVHQPINEVVTMAARTLKDMIENPDAPRDPQTTVIPARLVIRKSTARLSK